MKYINNVRDIWFACLLGLTACSVAPSPQPVATLPPKPPEPVTEPLEVISEKSEDDERSAGEFLEMGFLSYHNEDYDKSADFFSKAIKTGNLNDAGRALAYWHISESYRRLGDEDNVCEALASFVLVAQDVIDIRDKRRFAVDENGDFVKHFKLPQRIMKARAELNLAWAKKTPYFGRSLDYPVPVQSLQELEYFLDKYSSEFANNCPQKPDTAREDLQGGSIHHVLLKCDPKGRLEELYFLLEPEE